MSWPKRLWIYWRENLETAHGAFDTSILVIAGLLTVIGFLSEPLGLTTSPIFLPLCERSAALLLGCWCFVWLPFRRHEAQQEKHRKELSRLAQEVAVITSAERNKEEEKKKKDSRGVSFISLQAHIHRLRNTDPFEYAKELDKDGMHQESEKLLSEIFAELGRDLSLDEAAYFNNLTEFVPTRPIGNGALSKTIRAWSWQIDRSVFHAARLEKIIERHP